MARPSVTIRQGTFIGANSNNGLLPQILEHFLGIPYGLSTANRRRFQNPQRVHDSSETFDASRFGQRCPSGAPDNIPMGEDCLNANIYRPKARDQGKKLPVLVHFHGGAFNFGAGPYRDIPSLVAWSAEPILGITFNYRLGAFGFLPLEGALNIGLKDQILFLEWVQENIAAFGGDPYNVTIMGVSAGAHSIGHHIMQPRNPPLFHKAIVESGATTARAVYPYNHSLHVEHMQYFIKAAGLAAIPTRDLLTTLQSLSYSTIKAASEATYMHYAPSVKWPFQPVIDGEGGIIPIRPIDTWKQGHFAKIPIITGFNTNEGASFVPQHMASSSQFTQFFHTLLPQLSREDLEQLNKTYPDPLTDPNSKYKELRPGIGAQFFRAEQAYGHFAYIAPVRQTARFASKLRDEGIPIYLYHFAVNCTFEGGANHGDHSEFATYSRKSRPSIEAISRVMHAYWTSFIVTGNPNAIPGRAPERPEWPEYVGLDGGKKIVFGEGNDVLAGGAHEGTVVKVDDDTWATEECEYWWKRTEMFES